MNSRFEYLYRDASNYKRWRSVVFSGAPTRALESRIRASLHDGEWFIANQVRLPNLFFLDFPVNDDDHCWHEFSAIEATELSPDDPLQRAIAGFAAELAEAHHVGWRQFART